MPCVHCCIAFNPPNPTTCDAQWSREKVAESRRADLIWLPWQQKILLYLKKKIIIIRRIANGNGRHRATAARFRSRLNLMLAKIAFLEEVQCRMKNNFFPISLLSRFRRLRRRRLCCRSSSQPLAIWHYLRNTEYRTMLLFQFRFLGRLCLFPLLMSVVGHSDDYAKCFGGLWANSKFIHQFNTSLICNLCNQ